MSSRNPKQVRRRAKRADLICRRLNRGDYTIVRSTPRGNLMEHEIRFDRRGKHV